MEPRASLLRRAPHRRWSAGRMPASGGRWGGDPEVAPVGGADGASHDFTGKPTAFSSVALGPLVLLLFSQREIFKLCVFACIGCSPAASGSGVPPEAVFLRSSSLSDSFQQLYAVFLVQPVHLRGVRFVRCEVGIGCCFQLANCLHHCVAALCPAMGNATWILYRIPSRQGVPSPGLSLSAGWGVGGSC